MSPRRRKIFLILAIFCAGLILIIFSLELASKIYDCPTSFPPISCIQEVRPEMSRAEREKLIADLKDRRGTGSKITKQEYSEAAEDLILALNSSDLGYYNGKSCGNIGFVRNDLPAEAKKFVQRHELEHLLQTGKEKNREFSANLAAGKEYPLGLVQTIFFSLRERAKYYDSKLCYLVSIWRTFKMYFLP